MTSTTVDPDAVSGVRWCVPGVPLEPVAAADVVVGWCEESVEPAESVHDVVAALRVVAGGLPVLRERLSQVGDSGLESVMGVLGAAQVACEAMTVAVTGEAVRRGVPAASEQAMTPFDWVASTQAFYRGAGAGLVVQAAAVARDARHPELAEAVAAGVVPIGLAGRTATAIGRVWEVLPEALRGEEMRTVIAQALVTAAAGGQARAVSEMATELRARLGDPDLLDRIAERAHRDRSMSPPREVGEGLYDYRVRVDAAAVAALEAALAAVTVPRPGPEGEPDTRSSGQRRVDGLLDLIGYAVSSGDETGAPATGSRAQVVVNVDLDALTGALTDPERRANGTSGRVIGLPGASESLHLAPWQVRTLACQAGIIPVVLDGEPVVVDQGRLLRLFPPAMLRRIWLRDRGCTFPGCTMPAKWTQAHHLTHWSDGGTTTLTNAALLCGRHHTTVHTRRLHGRVNPDTGHVEWDTHRGSYDHALLDRDRSRDDGGVGHPGAHQPERHP